MPFSDHISDTGLPPYFEVYEMYLFNFNNNQLLLFPALVRVWYCLVGHDSHLAVCCMHPSLLRAPVTFRRLVYTNGRVLYSYKIVKVVLTLYLALERAEGLSGVFTTSSCGEGLNPLHRAHKRKEIYERKFCIIIIS